MINIAELLKDAPKGMKLYSPIYGEVEFKYIEGGNIIVKDRYGFNRIFSKYGKYFTDYDSECLLFPSKDYRTWNGWTPYVKPNFEVGDWVVRKDGETFYGGNYAEQITLIDVDEKGKCIWLSSTTWVNEDDIRLWTIADAKDGDVITNGKMIVIFNKLEEPAYKQQIIAYVGLDLCDKLQITEDTWQLGVDKAVPATKEQRDLLFAKMKEAGYEWDADKKELKKIQPHYDVSNFNPFDKVLTRDTEYGHWNVNLFSYYIDDKDERVIARFRCINSLWKQCIPYNDDTKHLLGTTDMCPEEYINW